MNDYGTSKRMEVHDWCYNINYLAYKSKDDFGNPRINLLQYAGTYELKEAQLK
jgi:hypothetical protein